MRHRHRFSLLLVVGALLLSGCTASETNYTPGYSGAQQAPKNLRPLAAGTAVIAPPGSAAAANTATDSTSTPANAAARTVRVGLLLPLSGSRSELGRALQDAATISLFDKYARLSPRLQTVRVELIPKDTGDTPDQAARAMEAALADGASFIIGPLFADATATSAPLARAKNIPVLSLSNTRTQAMAGTYLFGFSPGEQAARIVTYALSAGKSRIAALVPEGPLGDTVLTAARETAAKQGTKLVIEATYQTHGAGLDTALNKLVKAGEPAPFDAILIPEGGPALDTILRGLAARGVRPNNVQFLGTGLWDDAELLRRVNLQTAWFASSSPELTSKFETRFTTTYHYAPPRIASLSYDAVALAVTLATSGRPFDNATLTSRAGFSGPANGVFRLRPDGIVERNLAVMRVEGGNRTIISPAPEHF